MVYTETGKFKRDIKERPNGKQVTQIRVTGLSVNSKFRDNEELTIISTEDFTQLVNTYEDKITSLENQLNEAKNSTIENPNYTNKLIELQDIINNRNQLLFNTQNTINSLVNKLNNNLNEANTETKENIISLMDSLKAISSTLLDYNTELENQVKGINSSIDNTSWFKWITSKKKFKIQLDTGKLKKLEAQLKEFNSIDSISKAKEVFTPVELPDSLQLDSNDLDLKKLYIETGNNSSNNDIVINTPDK